MAAILKNVKLPYLHSCLMKFGIIVQIGPLKQMFCSSAILDPKSDNAKWDDATILVEGGLSSVLNLANDVG